MNIRTHTVYPEEFPEPWASDWGEDEFGLWMALTYKGVRQEFRWCEPGTFLMGSSQDEADRSDDEIQCEVRLTRGFWLADTTVTQALWAVVMDYNSSKFIGTDLPVERVSWYDVLSFIDKMNGLKAALKLCLPTEAQWEYACRAGTNTPFFWGEQIDSELVNFDGSRPYKNGNKSKFRGETIEVKSLPCNGWGFYQMHGNVWELCSDWYGEYPTGPAVDPRGPVSGVGHVLRGGSWFSLGRACRSAYRYNYRQTSRINSLGFRLARSY